MYRSVVREEGGGGGRKDWGRGWPSAADRGVGASLNRPIHTQKFTFYTL